MANEKRRRAPSPKRKDVKKAKNTPCSEKKRLANIQLKPTNIKEVNKKNDILEEDENDDFMNKVNYKGANFVNIFTKLQRGFCKASTLQQFAEQMYIQELRWFHIFQELEIGDLRCTAMQWHPQDPQLLVVGGKAGTLYLYRVNHQSKVTEVNTFPGVGPGGTMEAIRFNPRRSGVEVCTASVDGTISTYNFDTELKQTLVETESPETAWFCSVDVHADGKSVYGGNNSGGLVIHTLDDRRTRHFKSGKQRLHSSKIRHLEFSNRDPNLLVTASLDKKVKLWDIRKLSDGSSYVDCLEHDSALSSANFSLSNGSRLLTTDQYNELRVYQAPCWTLEQRIRHPHRQYHHMTHIKASWHPQVDVFVVGRYPDPKQPDFADQVRSVDVFSASTGSVRHELMDASRLITSLAYFNCSGDLLATSCGKKLYMWRYKRDSNLFSKLY